MPAELHDAPALEHEDAVGVHDRRKPVRDQDGDRLLIRSDFADRAADFLFRQRVERRGGFVENEQLRMTQERPCNRKALLLAAGDLHAAFSDQRIQPSIGAREKAVGRRLLQHFHTFGIRCRRIYKQQILADRSREQLRVLRYKADFLAQQIEVDA